jgi:hypothetical protein
VAVPPPTLNAAKTAEPTMRIWDVWPLAPISTQEDRGNFQANS